jgi:hypothetical protein
VNRIERTRISGSCIRILTGTLIFGAEATLDRRSYDDWIGDPAWSEDVDGAGRGARRG